MLLQAMLLSVMGMYLVVSKSWDHFLVKGNCTPTYPVLGNWLTVVSEMIMLAGLVSTELGSKVKEQAEVPVVMVTTELVPVVLEVLLPMVP